MVFGVWLSLVERSVRDAEVASSNLVTPILLYDDYPPQLLQNDRNSNK